MEYIRTFTRELEVGERVELLTDNRAGTVSVRGEETQRVRVEVITHLWADDDLEADEQADLVARGIRQEGKRVIIRAPALLRPRPFLFFSRTPRIEYQVTVPRSCSASIASRSGRVEVESIAGPLDVGVRSGRVTVRQIGADTKITSWSGSVHAESIAGSLVIESRSGGVRVSQCRKHARVHSRSGSVQIEEVGGNLELDTRSGAIGISEVGGSLKVNARSGAVRYEGPVKASFDIEVVSGVVRLAVDPDSSFFLDAESVHGTVRSDLPLRRKSAAPPNDAPTVRIRARSGAILLVPR